MIDIEKELEFAKISKPDWHFFIAKDGQLRSHFCAVSPNMIKAWAMDWLQTWGYMPYKNKSPWRIIGESDYKLSILNQVIDIAIDMNKP